MIILRRAVVVRRRCVGIVAVIRYMSMPGSQTGFVVPHRHAYAGRGCRQPLQRDGQRHDKRNEEPDYSLRHRSHSTVAVRQTFAPQFLLPVQARAPNRLSSIMEQLVSAAYAVEISRALAAFQNREHSQCFYHLERAHILGQRSTIKHAYAHWLMFRAGLQQRDFEEVLGQVPRMLASLLFSRIWVPLGNTGRSRVPATKAMPIPDDLRHLPL
jgi:hypothetical protein